MNAVLEIDLKPGRCPVTHHFIHACRTVPLGGFGIFGQVYRNRDRRIDQAQVRWLAFGVVGHRKADIGQPVERQLAIRLGIGDRLVLAGQFGGRCIGLAVFQRAQQRSAEQRIGPHIGTTHQQ